MIGLLCLRSRSEWWFKILIKSCLDDHSFSAIAVHTASFYLSTVPTESVVCFEQQIIETFICNFMTCRIGLAQLTGH